MIKKNIKNNKRGFVLLFAVTLSAILLAIALGVSNIALREVKFSTNTRDTNNAFFAADTAAECALYYDRTPGSPNNYPNAFKASPDSMNCAGNSIVPTPSGVPDYWTFVVPKLGSGELGCAIVTVDKTNSAQYIILSKGYNTGSGGNNSLNWTCNPTENSVERELEIKWKVD
ncbi:hypothetical protein EXS45_00740 [Candidatus Nomurabacteria bacterium]|nr:hypothetical protein [Candidatus Nomurabacteria bacterium]